jgi:SAM-dependent methyltransferase
LFGAGNRRSIAEAKQVAERRQDPFSAYGPSTYGDRIAELYDSLYSGPETESAVEFLAERARSGRTLELGIGTGRVALQLKRRGIDIHGIDASEAMVGKLLAKPGGDQIPIEIGDFADVGVDGQFQLIFIVFNAFFALTSQEDQIRCFRNVARRLTPHGRFVIEAFVPDLGRFDRGQRTSTERIELDRVMLEVTVHDPTRQMATTQHLHITPAGVEMYPVQIRYAWPSELDLMARLAGLELKERLGGWKGEPFTAESGAHVSVYGRP